MKMGEVLLLFDSNLFTLHCLFAGSKLRPSWTIGPFSCNGCDRGTGWLGGCLSLCANEAAPSNGNESSCPSFSSTIFLIYKCKCCLFEANSALFFRDCQASPHKLIRRSMVCQVNLLIALRAWSWRCSSSPYTGIFRLYMCAFEWLDRSFSLLSGRINWSSFLEITYLKTYN